MGVARSKAFRESAARNKALEAINLQDMQIDQRRIKLLLLGAGESGKSTILKQMKIIYGGKDSFPEQERQRMIKVIHQFILYNAQQLVNACVKFGELENPELRIKLQAVNNAVLDQETAALIKQIWFDVGAQRVWQEHRDEFQIQDQFPWFVKALERISAADYLPSTDDLVRTRVRTSGIQEVTLFIDGIEFVISDVGGQRNERKKWINCFDNVTAMFFIASVSEYNQTLYEAQDVNRFDDALQLFDETVNLPCFDNTSIILFLNKTDLLREKLKRFPLGEKYADYTGPRSREGETEQEFEQVYEQTLRYFLNLFLARYKQRLQHTVYHHFTNATDTASFKKVFIACQDIVLKEQLTSSGFDFE